MHNSGFVIDRSILDDQHVFYPRALSINIESGRLAFSVPPNDGEQRTDF
jgi:hypothetical protein